MNNNCPVDCPHCFSDRMEELEEREIARVAREEDDANFADQDYRDQPNYNLADE